MNAATELVPTRELRQGDVIHAESPRYHGPTFTVDSVDLTEWVPDTYRIVGHYGIAGQHPATLSAVPGGKPYRATRGANACGCGDEFGHCARYQFGEHAGLPLSRLSAS